MQHLRVNFGGIWRFELCFFIYFLFFVFFAYEIWADFLVNTFTFAICRRPSVCRLSVCRLSVVCNVRAPYSDDWNFRQCFYAIWYLGHLWPFDKKIYGDRPRGTPPSGGGSKPKRGRI